MWTSHFGLRSLQSAFVHNGAVIPSGVTLSGVLAISTDGSTIAGLWTDAKFNQGIWIARLHGKAFLRK